MADANPYGIANDFIANFYRNIDKLHAAGVPPITELKVTQDQLNEIRRKVPTDNNPSPIMALLSIPVILVDTEEESTLFMMTWESLLRRVGWKP